MMGCVFCKIIKKEIAAKFVYEDGEIVVFWDINPKASLHLLIASKTHIEDLMSPEMEDGKIWLKMRQVAKDLIEENKLKGYRLVVNGGEAKLVNHLHLHLLGEIGAERQL